MESFEFPSFRYHAESFAFSGEFVRPIKHLIEVQAGITLPFLGGHGQNSVENFAVEKLVSFRRGYSHVSGSAAPNGHHTTESTAAIEGLNVLDVVTADRVVARLTSDHDPDKREGHIIAVGSGFENLRIAGYEVGVELDHSLLIKNKNFAELSKNVASLKKSGKIAEQSNGVAICSLASSVNLECPGVTVDGHVITVPQFGKIFVAEVISWEGTRSISMLRFQLGSPHEGQLVAAGGKTNGTPWP
jgi:hypothetical protein